MGVLGLANLHEDYVGSVSNLGAACLPGTGISLVNKKIGERCRLARFVQLSRGLVLTED